MCQHKGVNVSFRNFALRCEKLLREGLQSVWYQMKAKIRFLMNQDVLILVRSLKTTKRKPKRKVSKTKIEPFMWTHTHI